MPMIIEMLNGATDVVISEADFAELIRRYMGDDAFAYFMSVMEELESYRSGVDPRLTGSPWETAYWEDDEDDFD